MAEWINSDGLRIRLGTTEAEVSRGGELPNASNDREIEFVIDLTTAATGTALVPDTTGIIFPIGWNTTEVQVENEVAATGSNATLNLGLVRQDTTTTYDADGFLAVAPRTDWDVVGEKLVYRVGTTGAGAFLGVPLVNSGVLVFDWDTAAFTAGRIKVTVRGYIERPAASN